MCAVTYATTERPDLQRVGLNGENHCHEIVTTTTTTTTTTKDPNYCCGTATSLLRSREEGGEDTWNLQIVACRNLTNGVTVGLSLSGSVDSVDCGTGSVDTPSTDVYGNPVWLVPSGQQTILAGQQLDITCTVVNSANSPVNADLQRVTLNGDSHCYEQITTVAPVSGGSSSNAASTGSGGTAVGTGGSSGSTGTGSSTGNGTGLIGTGSGQSSGSNGTGGSSGSTGTSSGGSSGSSGTGSSSGTSSGSNGTGGSSGSTGTSSGGSSGSTGTGSSSGNDTGSTGTSSGGSSGSTG